jgi:hypothetical protein
MTSRLSTSKVLLIADLRAAAQSGPASQVRRYRIARIRPENRMVAAAARLDRVPR